MTDDRVRIRRVIREDLSGLYHMQLDPESNRMAVTNPRSAEEFEAHWEKILADSGGTARTIVFDGTVVGAISCFTMDGQDFIGYWIDRSHWGKGIASRALELMLREVTQRPLIAIAASSNVASLRVLQKQGFTVEQVRHAPASARYPACEETVLVLR